jgi:hypothetical protein
MQSGIKKFTQIRCYRLWSRSRPPAGRDHSKLAPGCGCSCWSARAENAGLHAEYGVGRRAMTRPWHAFSGDLIGSEMRGARLYWRAPPRIWST